MEKAAFEALITGVNVFIFVIALSFGITLLTSVLKLSNIASEQTINQTNGSVIIGENTNENRVVTGMEILAYYTNYIDKDFETDDKNQRGYSNIKLYIASGTSFKKTELSDTGKIEVGFLNKKYSMIYLGKGKDNIDEYSFVEIIE